MVLSNVIVDVTIPCRLFVLDQSRAKVSAGFTNVRSLAVTWQQQTKNDDFTENRHILTNY